jgi:hypothetical protein
VLAAAAILLQLSRLSNNCGSGRGQTCNADFGGYFSPQTTVFQPEVNKENVSRISSRRGRLRRVHR